VKRALALATAFVMLVLPIALEHCRAACVQSDAPAAATSAALACHESPDETGGPTLSPMPRACGHSDDARTGAAVSIAAAKVRDDVALAAPALATTLDRLPVARALAPPLPPAAFRAVSPGHLPLRV